MLVAVQIQADHLKIRPNDATVQGQLFIKNSELSDTNGGADNGGALFWTSASGKIERYCQLGSACASKYSCLEWACLLRDAFSVAVIHGPDLHLSAGL